MNEHLDIKMVLSYHLCNKPITSLPFDIFSEKCFLNQVDEGLVRL